MTQNKPSHKGTAVKNNIPQSEIDGPVLINIYSKGLTPLGRGLTHFANTPFTHPDYGPFNCMEGFWHWFKSVERDDRLRTMMGHEALAFGRTQTVKYDPDFNQKIMEANLHKINQYPHLKAMLIESTKPFDHYYFYGKDGSQIIIRPKCQKWLCEGFEEIRRNLKANPG